MGYAVLIQERQWGDPHTLNVMIEKQSSPCAKSKSGGNFPNDYEAGWRWCGNNEFNSGRGREGENLPAGLTRNQFNQWQSVLWEGDKRQIQGPVWAMGERKPLHMTSRQSFNTLNRNRELCNLANRQGVSEHSKDMRWKRKACVNNTPRHQPQIVWTLG